MLKKKVVKEHTEREKGKNEREKERARMAREEGKRYEGACGR